MEEEFKGLGIADGGKPQPSGQKRTESFTPKTSAGPRLVIGRGTIGQGSCSGDRNRHSVLPLNGRSIT